MDGDISGFSSVPAYSSQSSQPASSNPQIDYYPPMDSFTTLQLRQVSSSIQTLYIGQGDPYAASYSIKVRNITNFLNKPDLLISRELNKISTKVGEGRFEKYSPGTTIKYLDSGIIQDLKLEDHRSQRFIVTVNGQPVWWWQPSKVDKYRMEIVTSSNRLLARFAYSGEHTFMGRDVKHGTTLGNLEVSQEAYEKGVVDQVVCMTIVFVERTKRRGRKLKGSEGGAPMTSLGSNVMIN